jgi:hypothetical protein
LKTEKLNCFLSKTGNRCKKIKENETNRKWKGNIRNMNKILVEKPYGKWPFGRSTHTHENTTKTILMETGYQRVE